MKVEKSFNKKTNIPLTEDEPSVLKAYDKCKDHLHLKISLKILQFTTVNQGCTLTFFFNED